MRQDRADGGTTNFPAQLVLETNQLDGPVERLSRLAFTWQDVDFADPFTEGLRKENILARDADDTAEAIGAGSALDSR